VSNGNGEMSARMTFGQALKIHQHDKADEVESRKIKKSTLYYWNQIFVTLVKGWPGLGRGKFSASPKRIVKSGRARSARLHVQPGITTNRGIAACIRGGKRGRDYRQQPGRGT